MKVFDKAKYHYESKNFPKDLKWDNAFIHTGFFICWLCRRDLLNDEFKEDYQEGILKILAMEVLPTYIYEMNDGVFNEEVLSEKGLQFTESYFDFEKGKFLKDYEGLFLEKLPTFFHVMNSWENYFSLEKVLDRRFLEWKKEK